MFDLIQKNISDTSILFGSAFPKRGFSFLAKIEHFRNLNHYLRCREQNKKFQIILDIDF